MISSTPIFRKIKNIIKSTYKIYVDFLSKLPITSEIIGPPKGFYKDTKDYWLVNNQESKQELQVKFISLYPQLAINRKYPITIEDEVHWKFEVESNHEHPETFVTVIPQGRAWGHNGTVITPDDNFLADLSYEIGTGTNICEHSILKQWKLPKLRSVDGSVAVLSAAGGEGYFHWIFDVLPRIHLLKKSGIDFSHIDKFLVNSLNSSFQKETLNILGIPKDKIIESRKFPHIKAKQLIVPSLPGLTGNMPKWACEFLRKEILGSSSAKTIEPQNRIYISRAQASYRRVINEDELVEFLKQLNFKIVFLEAISVSEQATIMSSASIVIAPHGAGLTNLVFCSHGTKLIELFSPNYVNLCYWNLANVMQIDYYYLIGEGNRPQKYCDPHIMADDILIKIKYLSEVLKLVGITS